MLRNIVLFGLVSLYIEMPASAQDSCLNHALLQPKSVAQKVQAELLAVKVGDGGMQPNVPPETQRLISSFKDSLASATDAYLSCGSGASTDAQAMERDVAASVGANGPVSAEQPTAPEPDATIENVYGANLRLTVKRPENRPELLLVQWSFNIDCGDDSVLLMYEHQDGRWKRALRWQSAKIESIQEAFGDFFQYSVVPLGTNGKWAVAVAHGHPWCTSRMSAFDIDVVSPNGEGIPPRVVFHTNYGYSRFNIEPVMKPRSDGFELRLEVDMMDVDIMTRKGIYRYRTVGNSIVRVQPIAMNGRDFVDEWLQTKWPDAERWSASDNIVELKALHTKIERQMSPDAHDWPQFSYGAVRACKDTPRRFQVEANEDPGGPLYFQILQGANSFTMLAGSSRANPKCEGADLMQEH